MRRNTWRAAATVTVAGAILLGGAGAAFADNCFNVRSGKAPTGNQPTVTGHWTYLCFGECVWAFEPPANYQNGTELPWLLAKTPYCALGGIALPNYSFARQTTHGVQSFCGAL